MAIFPKIQSPCPYRDRRAEIFDGDFCRVCKRQVHDLTDMGDAARLSFLASCEGEVCISYKAPLRIALAAMAASSVLATPIAAAACDPTEEVPMLVVMGGIKDPAHTQHLQDAQDAATPSLPVVYEDAKPPSPPADIAPSTARQVAANPTPATPPVKATASS